MGVDIMLGPNEYNPCHLHQRHQGRHPLQRPVLRRLPGRRHGTGELLPPRRATRRAGPSSSGVLFGGADWNRCNAKPWCIDTGNPVVHGWSDKATAWALEFYPGAGEGGVRIQGRLDQRTFGGHAWSGPIGAMRPITEATPGVFGLAVNVAGGPWSDRRFEVAAFQMPPWTMVTSAYYPEQGFAVLVNSGEHDAQLADDPGPLQGLRDRPRHGRHHHRVPQPRAGSVLDLRARTAVLRPRRRARPPHRAAGLLRGA